MGKTLVAIVNLPPRKMMGQESNGMLISAVHKEKGEEVVSLLMLDGMLPAGAKLCCRAEKRVPPLRGPNRAGGIFCGRGFSPGRPWPGCCPRPAS